MEIKVTRRGFLRATTFAAASTCFAAKAPAYPGNRRNGLPAALSDRITELYDEGHGIKYVALSPTDSWVVLYGRNGWASRGIPESLETKLRELNDAGKTLKQVSFYQDEGWIVLYDHDYSISSWASHGVPKSLTDALHRLDSEYSTVKCIAFTPDGGWSLLHGFNGFISEGLPESVVDALTELRSSAFPLKQIAYSATGGWVILYGGNGNGYQQHGLPDEAADCVKQCHDDEDIIDQVAFSSDNGWIVLYSAAGNSDQRYWLVKGSRSSIDPLHVYAQDFGDAHGRNRILQQAAHVLHDRFMDWNIIRNSYEISGTAYYIHDPYWSECNLVEHPQYGPRELLWYQLQTLCLPASAQTGSDEGPPMPEIRLYPYYRDDSSWGFARWVNRVMVKYVDNATVERTGDFHVHLNTYHLGSAGNGSDPYMWACVIAHEMLHNLGHAHDVDDYGDNRQVNCFHRALYCNGNYRGQTVPSFMCACKPPI